MTTKDAAWWRDYRAKRARAEFKQGELRAVQEMQGSFAGMVDPAPLLARIADLEAEVARLKRELAAQPTPEGEAWERDAWIAEAHKPIVYQPTILPPTRPDNRPIGTFGAPRPAPKPAPRKR